MSIHNLVAYLVGWGNLVMKWHENKNQGRPVDFPETGYKWNDLGALANKFYNDYKGDSYKDLLLKLEITTNGILNLVENKTNEELYVDLWYNKWTLGRLIQLNTSSPYKNATGRIRQWKKNRKI